MLTDDSDELVTAAFEALDDAEDAVDTIGGEYPVVIVLPSMSGVAMSPKTARMVAAQLIVAAEIAEQEAEAECEVCSEERDKSLN